MLCGLFEWKQSLVDGNLIARRFTVVCALGCGGGLGHAWAPVVGGFGGGVFVLELALGVLLGVVRHAGTAVRGGGGVGGRSWYLFCGMAAFAAFAPPGATPPAALAGPVADRGLCGSMVVLDCAVGILIGGAAV